MVNSTTKKSFYSGGNSCSLQLLPGLSDWSSVLGSSAGVSWSWRWFLPASFHAAAVLFLRWLAKGEAQWIDSSHLSSVLGIYKGFVFWSFQVAEQLINPFGEDDDDFETNWLVDRNLQVCDLYQTMGHVHFVHRYMTSIGFYCRFLCCLWMKCMTACHWLRRTCTGMSWNQSLPTLLPALNTVNPPSWAQHWISGELMLCFFRNTKYCILGTWITIFLMLPSIPKEEMEFQSNLEQIKEHEEANYSTPLLGGLGRLLGVQSPHFSRSSRVSLLRRRPGVPLSRFPLYLHSEAPPTPSQTRQPLNQEQDPDYAFSTMPLYERPGFYSCPQTPIHSVPPALPRPRNSRRTQYDWDRSCSSMAPQMVGSQLLPPDTPNHLSPPPSSALPWVGGNGETQSGPAFSFPDPPPQLCPISKLRPGHGLLSRRPPHPHLTLEATLSADSQPGPLSAQANGSEGERVFSFASPSHTVVPNLSNPNSSSSSINATSTNSACTTGSLCNGINHSNFSSHGNFSSNTRSSNGGTNGGLSSNTSTVSTTSQMQQETNQENSSNDSGISMVEGNLLGVLVDGGAKNPAARQQDWKKRAWL